MHTAYTARHNTLTEPTQAAECQYQDYSREFSPGGGWIMYLAELSGEEKQLLFLENSFNKVSVSVCYQQSMLVVFKPAVIGS